MFGKRLINTSGGGIPTINVKLQINQEYRNLPFYLSVYSENPTTGALDVYVGGLSSGANSGEYIGFVDIPMGVNCRYVTSGGSGFTYIHINNQNNQTFDPPAANTTVVYQPDNPPYNTARWRNYFFGGAATKTNTMYFNIPIV